MGSFVGVDPGFARFAAVRLDGPYAYSRCWSRKASRGWSRDERVAAALGAVTSFDISFEGAHVALEAPITGGSGNAWAAASIAAVWGALSARALAEGALSVTHVAPSSWKKSVVGRGNADKSDVSAWLSEYHPDVRAVCRTQDEVDAACLALYAKGACGGSG